jgi:hypothetical protein
MRNRAIHRTGGSDKSPKVRSRWLPASSILRTDYLDSRHMRTHTKQHFIPRFLLDAWAGDDSKLGVHKRLPNGTLRYDRRSPKAVAKIEHLYSIRRLSSRPDVFIEKDILGPIDDVAAPVYMQLLAHGVEGLSDRQRTVWARFLVAGLFRLPFMVDHFRLLGKERFQALETDSKTAGDTTDEGMMLFLRAIDSPKYNNKMRSAEWRVIDVPHGRQDALTCDLPFAYFGDFFGPAFSLVVPISPGRFFVCASGEYPWRVGWMTPIQVAKATNKRLVQHAGDYVYTTDERHRRLIEKWLTIRTSANPAVSRN